MKQVMSQILTKVSTDFDKCLCKKIGVILVTDDDEPAPFDLVVRLTEKASVKNVEDYFKLLSNKIQDQQLSQIYLPGKKTPFFESDTGAGIIIDIAQNFIFTDFRFNLPVKKAMQAVSELNLFELTPIEIETAPDEIVIGEVVFGPTQVLVTAKKTSGTEETKDSSKTALIVNVSATDSNLQHGTCFPLKIPLGDITRA